MTELRALWGAVSRRWLGVATLTLLGALAAALLNFALPVTYTASAQLFLATPTWNDSTAIPDAGAALTLASYGDEFSQQRMVSYQRLAVTPVVTGPVLEKLGVAMTPAELADDIVTRPVPDTVIMEIGVRNTSATEAAALANGVANGLAEVIRQLEQPSFNKESPVQPVLIRPATEPSAPTSPRVLLNIAVGACIGLLLGLTYATIRESGPRRPPLPVAGDDPTLLGVLRAADLDTDGQVPQHLGEDARFLRVQLVDATRDPAARTILLTSPRASEYVWEVAAALAGALAEVQSRSVVVLADFGMRVAGAMGPGLGDVLRGTEDLNRAISGMATGDGPALLLAGTPPDDPTAAITGARMRAVLDELAATFEYVLLVAPAVLESTDAVDLADSVGGSVMVCPPGPTDAHELHESRRLLNMARARLLGTVAVVDADAPLATAR